MLYSFIPLFLLTLYATNDHISVHQIHEPSSPNSQDLYHQFKSQIFAMEQNQLKMSLDNPDKTQFKLFNQIINEILFDPVNHPEYSSILRTILASPHILSTHPKDKVDSILTFENIDNALTLLLGNTLDHKNLKEFLVLVAFTGNRIIQNAQMIRSDYDFISWNTWKNVNDRLLRVLLEYSSTAGLVAYLDKLSQVELLNSKYGASALANQDIYFVETNLLLKTENALRKIAATVYLYTKSYRNLDWDTLKATFNTFDQIFETRVESMNKDQRLKYFSTTLVKYYDLGDFTVDELRQGMENIIRGHHVDAYYPVISKQILDKFDYSTLNNIAYVMEASDFNIQEKSIFYGKVTQVMESKGFI